MRRPCLRVSNVATVLGGPVRAAREPTRLKALRL
jgi:hypothetical protein